jgi:hypothetical protein
MMRLHRETNTLVLMKGNRNIEQRGPLGKTLCTKKNNNYVACCCSTALTFPYKYILLIINQMDTIIFQQMAMIRTSIRKGLIHSHRHHERQMVVFHSHTNMDEYMEKMVNQFAMTNYLPSTCVLMLHRMDDRLYDMQTVVNIFNEANKSVLEEKGLDMSSTKSQKLVDYLIIIIQTQMQ